VLPRRALIGSAVSTLVVHSGAIGDLLLACPALIELAKLDRVELAGNPARLALVVEAGIAHAAHDLDRIEFHTIFDTPSSALRTFLGRFDRAVVWMSDPYGAIRRGLAACGIERADVHPGLPDAQWTRHASEYYAACLALGPLPPLHLAVQTEGSPLDLVIHPGSGSPKKNWPIDRFVVVAQRLIDRGRRVTWCLGPAEYDRGVERGLPGDNLACADLVDLARRLATARRYVGNDSGIAHLAAALGVRTASIFGPTDPAMWAPLGENVCVLVGEPWPEIDAVLAALD